MNVSAIIVTRGDHDLEPILEELPEEWETLLWDNGLGRLERWGTPQGDLEDIPVPDLAVYGRYAAIEYASHDLIYVQDDDCVVSDPQAIVGAWRRYCMATMTNEGHFTGHVVCNMPPEFRHGFYEEHALVGFGAAFHRDAPERAFQRFTHKVNVNGDRPGSFDEAAEFTRHFRLTCDIVFTALTPRVLVDVPKMNLSWASASNRMYRQSWHQSIRSDMLDLIRTKVLA